MFGRKRREAASRLIGLLCLGATLAGPSAVAASKLPSCVRHPDNPLAILSSSATECLMRHVPCLASLDLCGPSALTVAEAIPFCADMSGEEPTDSCPGAASELHQCLADQACAEPE